MPGFGRFLQWVLDLCGKRAGGWRGEGMGRDLSSVWCDFLDNVSGIGIVVGCVAVGVVVV